VRRIVGKWTASRYAAVAVAGVTVVLAVSGCAQTRLGAAALYGNQRVSSSKLDAEVKNLNTAYELYKGKLQLDYSVSAMPRQVLSWMIRFATANKVAADEGIVVTPAQAQHELAVESANVKQSGDTLPEAAVANGLPPNMLPQLGIWISIEVQLDKKLDHGVAPKTTAGSNALAAKTNHADCLAAKSLNIKVNPQYGAYDYSEFEVVASPLTLAAASPAPSAKATTKPQLTPKC
jgi:parvulin-like peptidyl-prolyl isomerase